MKPSEVFKFKLMPMARFTDHGRHAAHGSIAYSLSLPSLSLSNALVELCDVDHDGALEYRRHPQIKTDLLTCEDKHVMR
jgi:hypothetical protein